MFCYICLFIGIHFTNQTQCKNVCPPYIFNWYKCLWLNDKDSWRYKTMFVPNIKSYVIPGNKYAVGNLQLLKIIEAFWLVSYLVFSHKSSLVMVMGVGDGKLSPVGKIDLQWADLALITLFMIIIKGKLHCLLRIWHKETIFSQKSVHFKLHFSQFVTLQETSRYLLMLLLVYFDFKQPINLCEKKDPSCFRTEDKFSITCYRISKFQLA